MRVLRMHASSRKNFVAIMDRDVVVDDINCHFEWLITTMVAASSNFYGQWLALGNTRTVL